MIEVIEDDGETRLELEFELKEELPELAIEPKLKVDLVLELDGKDDEELKIVPMLETEFELKIELETELDVDIALDDKD